MSERVYRVPSHLLDDLCSRFILNVPDSIRTDTIRLFFQIEQAHWFYIDFFVPEDSSLKTVGIKEFANQVFDHCPFLLAATHDVEAMHRDWKKYKLAVPTCGVILLDCSRELVLLVQGFSKNWGFPKGKVNEDETNVKAAIRELREETGHDVSDVIREDDYVEHTIGDQKCTLFIVPGVSTDTPFLPETRNEIKKLQWFAIDSLPSHKKDVKSAELLEYGPNAFFMVIPFLKPLKRWIAQHQPYSSPQKLEAQRTFARRNVCQFEELLGMSTGGSPRSPDRRPPRGGKKSQQGRHGTKSPQYTILQKVTKEESIKKVQNIKRSLDLETDPRDMRPVLRGPEQLVIKPCKEWKNFKLDIKSIVQSATQRR
ncbi:m7GpppN-mRNA hydrolase-like isoform X2 [Watersipora subatra]|uniref:m7GpppN-mRNA hydrolase-like isoform X2 n=1 Tax=Watersipora subatra TaxID=2589382 RepID=UPI00355B9088